MTITDHEVERALREREKARLDEAVEAAEAVDPAGKCPVCGTPLDAGPDPSFMAPFRERPPFRCSGCELAAPLRPSRLGEALGTVAAAVIGLYGLRTVLDAQQLTDGSERLVRFLVGGGLLIGGFTLLSAVQGARSARALGQRIAALRREREEGRKKHTKKVGLGAEWFGENLRELVFAAVLYLILRQFVVEAFVIPTGSMAPTLYGNNYRVSCARCEYPFAVGRSEGEPAVGQDQARCPVCAFIFPFDKGATASDGNKIIVNKLTYHLRPPERYEVFVFRDPQRPWQSFIKRLVGLPGDTLRIRHGDLWVDGELKPKPPHVQDEVWLPVHDARYPYPGLGAVWAPAPGIAAAPFEVAPDGSRVELGPGAWLDYDRAGHGVRDDTSYNRIRPVGQSAVGDLRISAVVTPARGAVTHLAIVEDERVVTASFPAEGAATAAFTLEAGGEVIGSTTDHAPLRADAPAEVVIAYADDAVRLIVDGRTLLAVCDTKAPRGELDQVDLATARLGATGGPASLAQVRIDRDIHYTSGRSFDGEFDPSLRPVTLPEGRYFAMGDNSVSSDDGRSWGFVHEGHIQGRAFLVWWPLLKPFDGRLVR